MADKVAAQKETEVAKDVVEKEEKTKKSKPEVEEVKDDSKAENGDAKDKENGTEKEEKNDSEAAEKVCPTKRKSEAGVTAEEKPAEGASPEKKAKLDETVEAESNGEPEVAA